MAIAGVTIRGATTHLTTSLTTTQSLSTTNVVVTQINHLGGGHGADLGDDTVLAGVSSSLLNDRDDDAPGATLSGGGGAGFASLSNLTLTGGGTGGDDPALPIWRNVADLAATGGGGFVVGFGAPGGGGGNSVTAALQDLLPSGWSGQSHPPVVLPVQGEQTQGLGGSSLTDGTHVQFSAGSPPGTIEIIFGRHG